MKVHWCHCGPRHGNFGDRLTPLILRYVGLPIEWAPPAEADLFGIGSIVDAIPSGFAGVVWTSGALTANTTKDLQRADVLALRGPLTRAHVVSSASSQPVLGDGGLLCHLFSRSRAKRYELGVIPHYEDANNARVRRFAAREGDFRVIDVCEEPLAVIERIASCRYVVSSSLHGLIVADSLGIPGAWVQFGDANDRVLGSGFKFNDYLACFGIADAKPTVLDGDEPLDDIIGRIESCGRSGLEQIQGHLLDTVEELVRRTRGRSRHARNLVRTSMSDRERAILERLDAPHFVGASELIAADTLQSVVQEVPRPFHEVIGTFRRCLDLLSSLQASGVVHRRISPATITTAPDGLGLADFGFALCVTPLTEQAEPAGEFGEDIHAVASVVEWLLAGKGGMLSPILGLMNESDTARQLIDARVIRRLVDAVAEDDGDPAIVTLLTRLARVKEREHELEREHWHSRIETATVVVSALVPPDAVVIVVDQDEWGLQGDIGGRRAIPFLEHRGVYGGIPGSANEAIEGVERLRHSGATHLVVGWPAFWWLDYFDALDVYLKRRCTPVVATRDFRLFFLSHH